ncbi:MAG: deoxynucleoside kinase [Lachnospiraceae bacterium]|nr:deoxynucleoside kinase [Lachnospiraceae bacterium]
MERTNYFIEGLQGAGKTTLVQKLSDKMADYMVFREGDYSPVELAWCAYVTGEQHRKVLEDYPSIASEIREKTVTEGEHKIICYTQILTDIPDFHRNLERFEIYNGNLDKASFEKVILERFRRWDGEGQIFECSVFQNIIENQMLYLMMADDEIFDFYRKLERVLADKPYQIVYLDVADISGTIEVIRKERSDDQGNELWFPLMIRYLEESPYGKRYALNGMEGLVRHLERRKALEHSLINELFHRKVTIVPSKNYNIDDII